MSYAEDDNAPLHLDVSQEHISSSLRAEFEDRLLEAIAHNARFSFPSGLLEGIAGHVVQEAAAEPYGLKGGRLHIQFEGHSALHYLATLDCDPETPAKTFELTLTLREAQATWGQRMARRLSFGSSSSAASSSSLPSTQQEPVSLSTSYKLVKRRTYRD